MAGRLVAKVGAKANKGELLYVKNGDVYAVKAKRGGSKKKKAAKKKPAAKKKTARRKTPRKK